MHRCAARRARHVSYCVLCFTLLASFAKAGIKEDVGLATLQARFGIAPTGISVPVAMTEAVVNGGYTPMTEIADFAGKHFEFRSGTPGNSAHATIVAENFFGLSNSIAPGVNTIELYEANNYISTGFLNAGSSSLSPNSSPQNSRVGNHSWISMGTTTNGTLDILEREDWVIDRDDYIQVVGVNNGDINTNPLFSNAMNAIAVGRTDGQHAINSLPIGGIYTLYRTRPEIVAPMGFTSFSTPVVAAASALLVGTAHNTPTLSDGFYTPSRFPGTTIYHGETSESIKAILLAGASRLAFNSGDGSALVDYREQTSRQATNGLDKRYGAGQLNVYNSYSILTSGEQNSRADGRNIDVLSAGFDYDPHFGGASGSNSSGAYEFIAGWTGQTLTASLAWNANIDITKVKQGNVTGAATLYDLNLALYDITGGTPSLVSSSTSGNQNTENLWTSLVGGRRYRLEVSRGSAQAAFDWDYSLAWSTVGTIGWRGVGLWDTISPSWIRGNSPAAYLPGEHVVFSDSGLNGQVLIAGPVVPGSVTVDNALVAYTFQGGTIAGATGIVKRGIGQLTLNNSNTYTGLTKVDQGLLRVTGSLTGYGPVSVAAGATFAVEGTAAVGAITGAGATTVGNGVTPAGLSARYVRQGSLAIGAASQVSIWPSGGTSVLGSLSIAGTPSAPAGNLDVNNNAAVIDYIGASPASTIRQQIIAGRGGAGPGKAWNGSGINSSAATAANMAEPESRSIGYAENGTLPLGAYTNFRGQAVDATSLLLAFTRTGDANLDGVVNDNDVTIVSANYAPGIAKPFWALGDFDYNGFVDDNDVTVLGAFYNPTAAPLIAAPPESSVFAADASSEISAVPEPFTFTLLVLGGAALLIGRYIRSRRLSECLRLDC